jgi:hypothetical protein
MHFLFLLFLLDDRRIWSLILLSIRMREAKKKKNPDLQYWFLGTFNNLTTELGVKCTAPRLKKSSFSYCFFSLLNGDAPDAGNHWSRPWPSCARIWTMTGPRSTSSSSPSTTFRSHHPPSTSFLVRQSFSKFFLG